MHLDFFLRQNRRKSGRPGESGQALIETAITLSMLFIMLIGAAEIGRIAWASIQVTNAARAAVQYGDQSINTAVDYTGMKTAAYNESPAITNLVTTPSGPVCTCANDGIVVDCSGSVSVVCPGSTMLRTITVQTSSTFDPLFHIPGTPKTYTLQAQAVQEVLSTND